MTDHEHCDRVKTDEDGRSIVHIDVAEWGLKVEG